MNPKVTILVPHYQTPELTLLCLRLLRTRTSFRDYETIVIDNGSQDESWHALSKVRWIKLLRRERDPKEGPARAHGKALNFGMEHARSPLVLAIHTDTMILRSDWIDYLINSLTDAGTRCAVVGSWKLESSPISRWIKSMERRAKSLLGWPIDSRRYVRSHCALYRKEAVERHSLRFEPSNDVLPPGKELHETFEREGFTSHFLSCQELAKHICHLNHATMALNVGLGRADRNMPRTRARALRRIEEFFNAVNARELLADSSLDF